MFFVWARWTPLSRPRFADYFNAAQNMDLVIGQSRFGAALVKLRE